MSEPISDDERRAAQDALNKLMAAGRISPTRFRDAMRTAVVAQDRAEFDELVGWLPAATDGRSSTISRRPDGQDWHPVPPPAPDPNRFVPTGKPRTPRQNARQLIRGYVLPLMPVMLIYALVLGIVGEDSAAFLPIALSFWPVMLVCAFILSRIRKQKDDPLFPSRPEAPKGPQDSFGADPA